MATIALPVNERSQSILQQVLDTPTGQRKDVMWWKDHQEQFQNWGVLPEHQWYCVTNSGKTCIWDHVIRQTIWPHAALKPPLPAPPPIPTVERPADITTSADDQKLHESIEEAIIQAEQTVAHWQEDQSNAEVLSSSLSPSSSAPSLTTHREAVVEQQSEAVNRQWDQLAPRFHDVVKERLHALNQQDSDLVCHRIREASWSSITCVRLWKSPLEAQQ